MKSRKLMVFIHEIQYVNRNPKDSSALNLLDDIATNPEQEITAGTQFYRSRVIHDHKKINKHSCFYGYGPEDSFVPPVELTNDMRANYRYIPYLYCADHPYLSIVEVRPRYGACVSVAIIKTLKNIRLLDFTMRDKPKKMTNAKSNLFDDLSELFSKSITVDDDVLDARRSSNCRRAVFLRGQGDAASK